VAKRIVLLAVAFVLSLAIVFVFAYRAGRSARQLRWAHSPVRPWMSVPFIAHTHHVPVDTLFASIHVQPHQPHDRRSLRHIAREEKRPVEDLIREIDQAIAQTRGASPPVAPGHPADKVP
jgi:hypothetical protein